MLQFNFGLTEIHSFLFLFCSSFFFLLEQSYIINRASELVTDRQLPQGSRIVLFDKGVFGGIRDIVWSGSSRYFPAFRQAKVLSAATAQYLPQINKLWEFPFSRNVRFAACFMGRGVNHGKEWPVRSYFSIE
jgi:hypothetical protein